MLHPALIDLANTYGLSKTQKAVFGRIRGVVISLRQIDTGQRQLYVAVNLSHLPSIERIALMKKFGQEWKGKLVSSDLDSITGCLEISVARKMFTKEEDFLKLCEKII